MDMYNKWLMRASGEGKHQANCGSEARVRATIDQMLELEPFKTMFTKLSSAQRSALFDQLYKTDARVSQNWQPKLPIQEPWWSIFSF